jgi:AraC family transcriptional regulator
MRRKTDSRQTLFSTLPQAIEMNAPPNSLRSVAPDDRFFGRSLFAWREGPLFATEHDYAAGLRIAAHLHPQPYVCIVTRGGYRERSKAGALDCHRSTMLLHPAGARHSDEFLLATRCLMLEVDAEWLARTAGARAFAEPLVAAWGPLRSIGLRLETEMRIRDDMTPLAVQGLLLETVAAASRARLASPPWLRRILDAIRDDPAHPHTLTALAETAGVHPSHLARVFRAHTGQTLGAYVRQARIERAKSAIAAGTPLAEIAASCGFADQSHFTRTFHRLAGETPAAFRRALGLREE